MAEVTVDLGGIVSSMKEKLQEIESRPKNEDPCTIYRVLPSIRNEDSGSYDPKIISIGPFHREKPTLKATEHLKWRFLHSLIHRDPENSLEKYIRAISSLESEARKCYSEPVEPNSNTLVELLVLDGCFIIEFLIKWNLEDHTDNLYAVNWNLPLLRNDLLLLENQVPFFILKSLFDHSKIPLHNPEIEKGCPKSKLLQLLALNFVTRSQMEGVEPPDRIHHLLHLFHSTLRPNPNPSGSSVANPSCVKPIKEVVLCCLKKKKELLLYSFYWCLSLLLYCRRPPPDDASKRAPRMIPSATELGEAGIMFKKKESRCLLDVTFSDGVIEMPLLPIQAATIPMFRNLVAFEQCLPESGSHFTCYVALIDNLVDTPADVLLLEGCGILESKLGGEEEVSKFCNSLGSGGYLDYENHYLVELFKQVKEYYGGEAHRWRARLVHDYFSNPWSIISLIAASVLLLLAALQTFFAVFAYFRPPKTPT